MRHTVLAPRRCLALSFSLFECCWSYISRQWRSRRLWLTTADYAVIAFINSALSYARCCRRRQLTHTMPPQILMI